MGLEVNMVMVIKKEVSVDSCEVAVSMRSYEAITRNGIRLFPLAAPRVYV